ncbi:hypothetical protein L3Q82_012814 [Scortum barcoo]|uniref:Uncharacterized protein n=1 Tax=Scortum barcoo TaxID=214431 RepID=A0ACB8W480_9TELE|nr:hypothetical protein L3Q82_012814 [Scortum barcoo]
MCVLQDQVVLAVRQQYVAIGDQVVTLGEGDEVAVEPVQRPSLCHRCQAVQLCANDRACLPHQFVQARCVLLLEAAPPAHYCVQEGARYHRLVEDLQQQCVVRDSSVLYGSVGFLGVMTYDLSVSQMSELKERRDVFKLSRDWLSVQEVVDTVSSSSCGAISVFIGVSTCKSDFRQDEVGGRKVIGLEYEAYEPMAQSEFSKLCADIRERWPTVTHVTWVEVGQASVVMAISSPHRGDGQQAIQHGITQLKANIPIWKKEVYDTQESSWKENAECTWGAHGKLHPASSSTENM